MINNDFKDCSDFKTSLTPVEKHVR